MNPFDDGDGTAVARRNSDADVDAILSGAALDDLDITTEDIDFAEIDQEITLFSSDAMVKEALDAGVDLRQYGRLIDAELRDAEVASVSDYLRESEDIASLHHKLMDCESILASMEDMLCGFQSHLGSISSEIRHLQDESLGMSVKVRNRKAVQSQLSEFVDEIVLPPTLIRKICEEEVNENYLEYLILLNQKLHFAEKQDQDVQAVRDVLPQLNRARQKAVLKIREFLIAKINALRKPKTNVQIIQQNVLLKLRYFHEFLVDARPEVALEVQSIYAQAASKIFHAHFRSYVADLTRMQCEVVGKADVIAAGYTDSAGSSLKSFFSSSSSSSSGASPFGSSSQAGAIEGAPPAGNAFALGERAEIFGRMDDPSIVAHAQGGAGKKYTQERLYRSLIRLLIDSATSEFLFLADFFGRPDMFDEVFSRALAVCKEWVDDFLFTTHDSVAILLMIRVTYHFQMIMQRRRVPCLDNFFDGLKLALWPRFKAIFDANLKSIGDASAKSIFSAVNKQQQQQQQQQGPSGHVVVRRYADFVASIYAISVNEDDEMVYMRLRQAMGKLITQVASLHRTSKQRTVFLINNYDLILTILRRQRETAPGPVGPGTIAGMAKKKGKESSGSSGLPSGSGGASSSTSASASTSSSSSSSSLASSTPGSGEDAGVLKRDDNVDDDDENLPPTSSDFKHYRDLVNSHAADYIEEELSDCNRGCYSKLIAFVKETEPLMQNMSGEDPAAKLNASHVESLVKEFASVWKQGIEAMNREINVNFPNKDTALEILKMSLTQLLLYYTRFLEIIKHAYKNNPPFANAIVPIPTIMYQIRGYAKN